MTFVSTPFVMIRFDTENTFIAHYLLTYMTLYNIIIKIVTHYVEELGLGVAFQEPGQSRQRRDDQDPGPTPGLCSFQGSAGDSESACYA